MRNILHGPMDLNVLSPVQGPVWGGYGTLGGGALLEEAHHWEWALRVHSLTLLPGHSFCFMFVVGTVISQLSALAVCLLPCEHLFLEL